MGTNGSSEEILAHPWFKSIDIGKLTRFELKPPHNFANQDGTINTKHFDVKTNKSALELSEVDPQQAKKVQDNQN